MSCSNEAADAITTWFNDRIVTTWFTEPVCVDIDREEILVTGALATGVDPRSFRESTRAQRVDIAREAEGLFGRKVSWGVRSGDQEIRFTSVSVPVMTRLRIDERQVLDALIAGGIARSRSDALGWCVRLVAHHESDWLTELTDAAAAIASIRERGPQP